MAESGSRAGVGCWLLEPGAEGPPASQKCANSPCRPAGLPPVQGLGSGRARGAVGVQPAGVSVPAPRDSPVLPRGRSRRACLSGVPLSLHRVRLREMQGAVSPLACPHPRHPPPQHRLGPPLLSGHGLPRLQSLSVVLDGFRGSAHAHVVAKDSHEGLLSRPAGAPAGTGPGPQWARAEPFPLQGCRTHDSMCSRGAFPESPLRAWAVKLPLHLQPGRDAAGSQTDRRPPGVCRLHTAPQGRAAEADSRWDSAVPMSRHPPPCRRPLS